MEEGTKPWPTSLHLGLGWLIVAISMAALVGWVVNWDLPRSFIPGAVMVKPNTAIGFLLLGTGILFLARSPVAARICALLVLLLTLVTLAQSVLGWNLGVDELLFKDTDPFQVFAPPGRMGITTSFSFVLSAAALWLLTLQLSGAHSCPFILGWIGSMLLGMSFFSVAATWAGYTQGSTWETWITMAMPAALVFAAVGGALVWASWIGSAIAWEAPTWLGLSFVAGVMVLTLFVTKAMTNNRQLLDAGAQMEQIHARLRAINALETAVNDQQQAVISHLLDGATTGFLAARVAEVESRLEAAVEIADGLQSKRGFEELESEVKKLGRSADRFAQGANAEAPKLFSEAHRISNLLYQNIAEARAEEHELLNKYTVASDLFAGGSMVLLPLSAFLSMVVLISAFFLLSKEINGRQKALNALSASEERFRTMTNSIPHMVWMAEPDGRVIWHNNRFYEYSGLTPEQDSEAGDLWKSIVEPQMLPLIHRRWENAVRTGAACHCDVRLRSSHGDYRTFLVRAIPLKDQRGLVVRWFGTNTDMEDYRRAMSELQRKEFELRLSQQLGHIGTFDWDIPSNRIEWSPELEALYGLPPSGFGGRYEDWRSAVHPDDLAGAEQLVSEALETGSLLAEWRTVWPNGTIRWIGARASVSKDDAGRPLHMIGANFDITELKEAEEQIRSFNLELERRVEQRTRQLQAANEELESFTYSVSHDLRAPLRALDGFSRMLLDQNSSGLDAESQRMLGIVRKESQRMGQLIDDLLTFSRLGRQAFNAQPVEMQGLVEGVIREVLPRYPGREIDLQLGELPAAVGQASMLRQVWVNLFDNALKFTRSTAPATITICGSRNQSELVYSVKDNGVGFDMRFAGKLFGVFQRLHSQEEFPGTGVGLALVKRIIQRHGGRVWAESRPGHGATFFFALPCNQESIELNTAC